MIANPHYKHALLAASLVTFAACGGGGGGGSTGGSSNTTPTANAGADQSVDEQTTVSLSGVGSSDADGDSLSYSWTQTAGAEVSISNSSAAQASFDAPDVGVGSNIALSFQLRVSDGRANDTDTVVITVNGVSNSSPTVDAGLNQTAAELSSVSLSGTAADSDLGDTLTYTWTQTAGPAVTIDDADTPNASFSSPDVGPGGDTLTFELAVNDGTDTVTDTVDVLVTEALAAVTVAGRVFYEFVPPIVQGNQCDGLDFDATEMRPIRRATVQLLDSGNSVLGTTVAGDDGSYSFGNIPASTDVRVRVRAELKQGGTNAWDVEVRDNVDLSANPPPLQDRPLYVVQWALFNTGTSNIGDADFTATSGWENGSYRQPRLAAPFAILDSIYTAMELVLTADPGASFPPLDAFWSVNNTLVAPSNVDVGELSTSFYRGDIDSLFLLGDSQVDTEEFDDHIINHEWFHYFEDNFSRSDSIGGSHLLGESLDLRLAFGEGFAHALSSISLNDPQYCDTGRAETGAGSFGFNAESNNSGLQGWFNELSVMTFIYDLWDTNVDASDDGSIGFGPIYDTMVGPQRTTDAFTTIFSFAAELRPMLNAADRSFVDAQLNRENVDTPNVTIWGDGQVSTPAGAVNGGRDLTPVYTEVQTNGSIANVCINNDYIVEGVVNKLSDWRYLRFTTPSNGRWTITVQANPVPPPTNEGTGRDRSDPDIFLYQRGAWVDEVFSTVADVEVLTTDPIPAGTYVIELQEWRHADDGAASDFPSQVCYDVSIVAF